MMIELNKCEMAAIWELFDDYDFKFEDAVQNFLDRYLDLEKLSSENHLRYLGAVSAFLWTRGREELPEKIRVSWPSPESSFRVKVV